MKLTLDEPNRRKLIAARGERSLREVAEHLPISHTQLARIENGERGVDEDLLKLIAKQYGLKVKVVQRVDLTARRTSGS